MLTITAVHLQEYLHSTTSPQTHSPYLHRASASTVELILLFWPLVFGCLPVMHVLFPGGHCERRGFHGRRDADTSGGDHRQVVALGDVRLRGHGGLAHYFFRCAVWVGVGVGGGGEVA